MIAQMSCQDAPACTLGKKIITLKMALNLEGLRVSARAHAQLSYVHTWASHEEEITGKLLCTLLYITNRSEWMEGICLEWSRGRHFSPSLLGGRYQKLGSKSHLRAEISGSIVWYDALAPRPEVLRSISSFFGNLVLKGYN